MQERINEWQTLNREEREARHARINERLKAFDARRDALEARLSNLDDETAARLHDTLKHFDSLRSKRRDLLNNRPRLANRLEKAFPTMKWINKKG